MNKPAINFTNKDFSKIKEALVNNAKLYYPETNKNFNQASFGSMVLDAVSYVGDMLSFYIDYQYNEQFLDTSNEIKNILKIAKQNGFRDKGVASAQGSVAVYFQIPADSNGLPNYKYVPTIKAGTKFQSSKGINYIVTDDFNFNVSTTKYVVSQVNSSGFPTRYAIKNYVNVISGDLYLQTETVASYADYLKLRIKNPLMSEIVSVVDSEGNEYFEVDNLSENIIYKSIKNTDSTTNTYAPYKIQKQIASRRFTIEYSGDFYYLVFGNGSIEASTNPADVSINMYGRNYQSNTSFDPSNILKNDKFGIGPSDTTLSIIYRANNTLNSNAGVSSINKYLNLLLEFSDQTISQSEINQIRSTAEIDNEEVVSGFTEDFTNDDLKYKALGAYSSQNRLVTANDYVYYCYNMHPKYGQIKRANIAKDISSARNALNLYIISEDENGYLVNCNSVIKENLKKWIEPKKMLNDIINIHDAKIANISIEFVVQAYENRNKIEVLTECVNKLKTKFATKLNIGEALSISDIYKTLNIISSVVDTKSVLIKSVNYSGYSQYVFDIYENLSADETYIDVPQDTILEIKYPDIDLKGTVI